MREKTLVEIRQISYLEAETNEQIKINGISDNIFFYRKRFHHVSVQFKKKKKSLTYFLILT